MHGEPFSETRASRRVIKSLLFGAAVIASAVVARPQVSIPWVVDSLADVVDAGDGVLTLREALASAASGDTIDLTGLDGTIALTSVLVIDKSVELIGPGAASLTISGENQSRVFQIEDSGSGAPSVVIRDVTVANGFADSGAGIYVGLSASLELFDAVVTNCSADDYYGGTGGGLYNAGTTTIVRCEFTSNQATGFDTYTRGGAIFNDSDFTFNPFTLIGAVLEIRDSIIRSNSAGYGAGINNDGILTISDSEVAENTAAEAGGGLSSLGQATIVRSLFRGNVANGEFDGGGGIFAEFEAQVLMENSTVSGNSAPNGEGGGILVTGTSGEGDVTTFQLLSSTIAENQAMSGAGGAYVRWADGVLNTRGSIFGDNFLTDGVSTSPADAGTDGFGEIVSGGYNIVQVNPGAAWPAGAVGDQLGVDPLIGLLADNGGPTMTHALVSTSPAIDAGDPLYDDSTYSNTDQRGTGFPRIIDGDNDATAVIDIGAFEFQPAVVCTDPPTVTLVGNPAPTVVQGPLALCAASYEDPGAFATDCDGNELSVDISYPSGVTGAGGVVTFPGPGMYSIAYSATDSEGRTTQETRTVTVVDTLPPTLDVAPGAYFFDAVDPVECGVVVNGITVNATDCSGAPTISFAIDGPGETRVPITFPRQFPVGTTTVYVTAEDAYGNSTEASVLINVTDSAPPVITLNDPGLNNITIPYGSLFDDPGATAVDGCDGAVAVTTDPYSYVDTCYPGEYVITYYATDSSENQSMLTRTITVADPDIVITVPQSTVMRDVDPALCQALVDLDALVSITGLDVACEDLYIDVQVLLPDAEAPESLEGPGVFPFPVGTSVVTVQVLRPDEVPIVVASGSFTVQVSDPYMACLNNVAWPLAYHVPLIPLPAPQAVGEGSPDTSIGVVQQFIARAGESRWYRFTGAPGSRIIVTLSDLPENFDVVVYTDIQETYNELVGLVNGDPDDQLLALLGAEFAPEAYSPEAYSPEAYSPEAYSPEAYSPEAYSPEAYSPEAYSPEAYSPEAYSPEAYSPEAYSPEAYSPEAYSPEAYSPEAYSGAQARSLVAFSAGAGTTSEVVQFNTFSRTGEFYIRVRGQNGIFSTAQPYTLSIQLDQEICKNVSDFDDTPASIPATGSATSLILWDSSRIEGTPTEIGELSASLAAFASEANAFVYDLSGDPRVNALNAQADANPACPLAKNLIGEVIRNIILGIRAANPGIQDITLVGNDDAIPFFRTNDEALLASEANYFPPVFDDTHSNSSLRYAQVLTQDRYGSKCRVYLSTGPFDLPGIPVARLVETAPEVKAYLDAYKMLFDGTVNTGGVLPVPESLFVAGYDFLDDAAAAVRDDFALGLGAGATVESLISPFGQAPGEGWTADQLRSGMLGTRHDVNYLAGHFSQSGALAADYTTRMTAGEVAGSATDLSYTFFMSTGCHSGFSTANAHAIPVVTEQPDWAQALMQKLAIWLAGTGYQYGDTDFLEYSERFYLEMARALRMGSGPVSIGQAMVAAKKKYLAETPLMRGIHEKALLEVVLYGLPMIKMDLPGARLAPSTRGSDVGSTTSVAGGPGAGFALAFGDLNINPALTQSTKVLDVIGPDGTVVDTVVATWLEGSNGRVTLPVEPIRPLETRNVINPAGFAKDVLFLGGDYTDMPGITPLTGAPATEIRGVHGIFSTEVFYPIRPWNLNHLGLLCGGGGASLLNAFPAQYISDAPGSPTGTMRQYSRMAFRVYYSPDTSADALAAAPAINVVSSEIDGADIVFTVEVAAGEPAGVQEVVVNYSGLPGSAEHGSWQPLFLAPAAGTPASGIGTWTGRLTGGAANAASLYYMVQAVNGVGRVSLNSNFGRYFRIGDSTLDGVGAAAADTALELLPPVPTSLAYRETFAVSARLTDGSGNALGGKRVTFRIGPQVLSEFTDGAGNVTVSPTLGVAPGAYQLVAAFAGDADYRSSSASAPLAVTAQGTSLAIVSEGDVEDVADILARLVANDGTPLKEKTIIFVISGPGGETAVAAITDGAGRARPTGGSLPAGSYQVSAYFAQQVGVPGGNIVTLSDPLYGPSSVSANVSIGVSGPGVLDLSEDKVFVHYSDKRAPGASKKNRGHGKTTFFGRIQLGDSSLSPDAILASPDASHVLANLSATLSGKSLVDGDLDLRVWGWNDRQWFGKGKVGDTRVFLHIGWQPPSFLSRASDPDGPEIKSLELSDSFALLSYRPVKGSYETVISGSGGVVKITVKKGRVKKITGGLSSRCSIRWWGRSAVVALPFALADGDTVVTSGDVESDITVESGVNLFGARGNVQIVIDTPKKHGPLYNDTPATLELNLTLGAGAGETPFGGAIVIGDSARPWTKEKTNLRVRMIEF